MEYVMLNNGVKMPMEGFGQTVQGLTGSVDASCQIIEGKVNASAAELASWAQSLGL